MSLIDYQTKSIYARVSYVGPAGSGKTTSLRYLWEKTRTPGSELVTSPGATAGTYDVLPVHFGVIRGFALHFELVTMPGGDAWVEKRRELLAKTDGVLFVADASPARFEANAAAWLETRTLLASHGFALERMPRVLQVNKCDAPSAVPGAAIATALGAMDVERVDSVATRGLGVFDALKAVSKSVLKELSRDSAAAR